MKTPPPSIPQIIDALFALRMANLHVALPGAIVKYDRDTQTAQVQPMIKRGYKGEAGERFVETLPVINAVPVMWLGGSAAHITMPLAVGDTGLLVFCEQSIDRWKSRGAVIDPEDDRRFHLSDAVFYPGLRAAKNKIGSNGPAGASVFTSDDLRLGSKDAEDRVLTTVDGADFMTALQTAITACTAANPVAAPALVALQEALTLLVTTNLHNGQPWPVGAAAVKAEGV